MQNSQTTNWIAYAICVGIVCCAGMFSLTVIVAYRFQHPESIHGIFTVCMLIAIFGAPAVAVFGSLSLLSARKKRQMVPSVAAYSITTAWLLVLCVAVALFVAFARAWFAHGLIHLPFSS